MFAQIPIDLGVAATARFEHFEGGENRQILQCLTTLEQASEPQVIYLWGAAGVGKTHLLQAACAYYGDRQHAVMYLPLAQLEHIDVAVLDGVDRLWLVCIDDVQAVAGNQQWEHALFVAYNRMNEAGTHCIFGAPNNPRRLGLGLPDLQSRLAAGLTFHVQDLDDEGKIQVLQHRAQLAGFDLPNQAAVFLLSHLPRDLAGLCGFLQRLDQASLSAQRKLTIPFIKTVLADDEWR